MFHMLDKRDNIIYPVFDVQYDSSGFPVFLVFRNMQWLRNSAKHYIPVESY